MTAGSERQAARQPNAAQDTPKKSTTPSRSPSQTSRNGTKTRKVKGSGYLGYYHVDIRSNDLRAAVTVKPAAT